MTGIDPRAEAVDQIDQAWELARASHGADVALPIQLATAQTLALIYVGDALRDLARDYQQVGA